MSESDRVAFLRANLERIVNFAPQIAAGRRRIEWQLVAGQLQAIARDTLERDSGEAEPPLPSWSDARSYLMQGASIQQDYMAGKYANYEEFAARIDQAAREIADGNRFASRTPATPRPAREP